MEGVPVGGKENLHVEPEVHDVAVAHHVVLPWMASLPASRHFVSPPGYTNSSHQMTSAWMKPLGGQDILGVAREQEATVTRAT
jgi:hypothetical protein